MGEGVLVMLHMIVEPCVPSLWVWGCGEEGVCVDHGFENRGAAPGDVLKLRV